MSDVAIWTVFNGSQQHGPFSPQQLIELAKAKRIGAKTLLLHPQHTAGKQVPADSIRQLKAIFDAQQQELLPPVVEPHPEDVFIEHMTAKGKAVAQSGMKLASGVFQGISTTVNAIGSAQQARAEARAELSKPANELADFMSDGQDPKMVARLLERVKGICMSDENPLYMAVQQRPIANFSPDAVVLTNRRFVIFQQKLLGRLTFRDFPWRDVKDVHLKEDLIGSTITVRALNGIGIQMEWLPKDQARKVYRIAQEQEENAHQHRRDLLLEEKRATAANTIINTSVHAPAATPVTVNEDPMQKLSKLKQMLEAGLIEQSEYDATKARILQQM